MITSGAAPVGTYTHKRDHEMRRVLKQDPFGVTTTWRYGVGRNPLEETTGNITTSWFYLAGVPLAAVASNTTTSNLFYVYADRMNTPRKVIRSNAVGGIERRLAIDPWGHGVMYTDFVSSSGPQPNLSLRRSGQIQDTETKLIDNGYRMLMPDVGQYTSPEPLHRQTIARTYGPQSYAYAAGRPLSIIDPDGRKIRFDFSEIVVSEEGNIPGSRPPRAGGKRGETDASDLGINSVGPCRTGPKCDEWGFDVKIPVLIVSRIVDGYQEGLSCDNIFSTSNHEKNHRNDIRDALQKYASERDTTEGHPTKAACELVRAAFIGGTGLMFNDWLLDAYKESDSLRHGRNTDCGRLRSSRR